MTNEEIPYPVSALQRQQKLAFKNGFYPDTKPALRARGKWTRHHNSQGGSAPDVTPSRHVSASDSGSKSINRGYHGNPALASSKLGTGPSRFDPQPLQAVVGRITNRLGWSSTLNVATIAARWPEVVGELVAQHCQVETFDDNVLVVRASSTAWANQMKILLPTLERNIRETLGTNAVKQVIIRGPAAPSWRKGPLHVPGRGPRDTYG